MIVILSAAGKVHAWSDTAAVGILIAGIWWVWLGLSSVAMRCFFDRTGWSSLWYDKLTILSSFLLLPLSVLNFCLNSFLAFESGFLAIQGCFFGIGVLLPPLSGLRHLDAITYLSAVASWCQQLALIFGYGSQEISLLYTLTLFLKQSSWTWNTMFLL